MASTINASSTGSGGLITTGDASGELALQANGVTQATVSSTGLSLASTASVNALNTFGFENRLINGRMQIDQYNSGAAVTNTTGLLYPVDRFPIVGSVASKFTAQQSATAPTGFTNSLLCTSLSAYTVGASEDFTIRQYIEGFNSSDLAWGSASAATVNLSFWVRSSLTGTFGGSISNSAQDRFYVFSYTINSANTWEQKTITIAGDTTGTWLTTNGIGIRVLWSLGAGATVSGPAGSWGTTYYRNVTGATSVVGTNGATFYITGTQFERGSQATSFDFRDIGRELLLCYRYYQSYGVTSADNGSGSGPMRLQFANNGGVNPLSSFPYPCTMRASPTLTVYGGGTAGGNWTMNASSVGATTNTNFTSTDLGPKGMRINGLSSTSGGTAQYWADVGAYAAALAWTLSAEL